jgi:cobalamin biosynthesis protein CobD/CbiB
MAAMAGALGVLLEKSGAYRLGAGELPVVGDVDRSLRVLAAAVSVSLAVLIAAYLAMRRLATTGALA